MKYISITSVKKHKIRFILLCIIIIFIVFCTANLICSNTTLTYSRYEIQTDKIKNNVTFAAISDSEGKEFGSSNSRLIEKIENANPEFVLILGDMVNRNNGDFSTSVSLCKKLAKKFPVYYTLGNHENEIFDSQKNSAENFIAAAESVGANVLVNEMTDYTTDSGEKITIGGLKQFPFFEYDAPDYDNPENHFFQSYLAQQDDKHFSVLMCHYPEAYIWKISEYNIDLMMCGHTHGGMVRLPFIGGLYAPEQGWFPDYDKGYYSSGSANMIINAGLSTSVKIPRFNNPPDITIVTLKAK